MQTFADLVGTAAVPAYGFDIAELAELTPALATAQATQEQASEAALFSGGRFSSAAERPTEINH